MSADAPAEVAARPELPPRRDAVLLFAVVILRLSVSLALLAWGFHAISDDDFSRVVIAQGFALSPRLDPSGTSWLPFPFWITGGAMALFGPSLEVARGVALVTSVASVVLVHRAALWVGATAQGALLAATIAAVLPTAARLGVSFQPEGFTAALVVLGAAATTEDVALTARGTATRRRAWLGAAALAAACLCRYEAWAAAAAFSVLGLRRALASGSRAPLGPTALALAAPAAWMLHGALAHGSPLFFLHRVASFRRALGEHESVGEALLAYPRALLVEPELVLGAGALVVAGLYLHGALRRRDGADRVGPWSAPPYAVVIAAVLVFLVTGRLVDGAPTHHPERTVLPVWLALALAAANHALRLPRAVVTLALGTAAVLGAAIRLVSPEEVFEPRAAERAIGALAREHVPPDARLAVDTPDYGYFAVIAAFQDPSRAVPAVTRDPRATGGVDPFASAASLAAHLRRLDATWLVADRAHWGPALLLAEPVAVRGPFALMRVLP